MTEGPWDATVDPERGCDGGAGEALEARLVECILAGGISAIIQHCTYDRGEKSDS